MNAIDPDDSGASDDMMIDLAGQSSTGDDAAAAS